MSNLSHSLVCMNKNSLYSSGQNVARRLYKANYVEMAITSSVLHQTDICCICCHLWLDRRYFKSSKLPLMLHYVMAIIIPMHMMNKEIIPGNKKGLTVSSINCDRCMHLDLAVSSLPAAPA